MATIQESNKERIERLIRKGQQHYLTGYSIQPCTLNACGATYDQNTFELKRKTNEEIKISVLTEENQNLKAEYADLVKKTTILLEANKKLEAENEVFKKKKVKQDSWENGLTNLGKSIRGEYDKFIDWLKT